MWVLVKNNEIVKRNIVVPKSVYDADLDKHIDLLNYALKKKYGYYKVEKDRITQPSKVYGEVVFDAQTDRAYYQIVDRVYSDIRDDEGNLIKTALEARKDELLFELKSYRKKAYEEGKQMDDYYKDVGRNNERQALQAKVAELYQLHEKIRAQIEALTTIDDAANYTLPMDDINAALTYLRELV